jgi:hypothetical protein
MRSVLPCNPTPRLHVGEFSGRVESKSLYNRHYISCRLYIAAASKVPSVSLLQVLNKADVIHNFINDNIGSELVKRTRYDLRWHRILRATC